MELTTYDFRKGKVVKAGNLKDGVFSRKVNKNHFCWKFKGYGIQESLVQSDNFKMNVCWIEFHKGKQKLRIKLESFMAYSILADLGSGSQRFINERYLEELK